MKSNRVFLLLRLLVVFMVSGYILLGIVGCQTQPKASQPVSPSLTQVPPTLSTAPPIRTPLTAGMDIEYFFGDTSCSWPCWQGITPGITSDTEAIQRLNDSPLVLQNSIQTEEPVTGFGDAKWQWKIGDKQTLEGHLAWRRGLVHYISLTGYPIITLGEILDRFGPPERVSVSDCTEIPELDHREWCTTLYYAKKGFEIQYNRDSSGFGDDIQIEPSDPIDSVALFKPSTIEDWLLSMGFEPHPDLQDWKGYGNLLDLYVR